MGNAFITDENASYESNHGRDKHGCFYYKNMSRRTQISMLVFELKGASN